jgi:hypothetical protein
MSIPGYDAWKLDSGYESDEPERQDDPGPCRLCNGSGEVAVTQYGKYLGPGPVPDYARVRGARCDSCGGSGEIFADEED